MTFASAPGKVLWAGEYAVLDGATALITAVDRRVVARTGASPTRLSPFLAAVRHEVTARHGLDSREARAAGTVTVDSTALFDHPGGRKLGLGSSAAVTVAAAAAALGSDDVAAVHELAHAAHARAQAPRGARGSGADIAASVHGGALALTAPAVAGGPLGVARLVWPAALEFTLIWTGQPADTPTLVARVRRLREHDPDGHARAIAGIAAAAERLVAGFHAGDARAVVAAVAGGHDALAELSARAGAALIPDGLDRLRALAAAHHGAVKPTGAGGGDLILAAFAARADLDAFRAALATTGMIEVTARVDPRGVQLADVRRTA